MSAKIKKWGNSLGIRVPKTIIDKAKLDENSEVEIEHKNGNIIIIPIRKKYNLDQLLKKVTKSNLHNEESFEAEGSEVW